MTWRERMSWLPIAALVLLATSTAGSAGPVTAPSTSPGEAAPQSDAQMSLELVTEEGQKLIRAVVTARGKPLENLTVSFGVKRTFGTLRLGEDRTLDDGSAAIKFPADIPGGPTGTLDVIARVEAPPEYASTRAEGNFGGAREFHASADPLPRALWAPRAPYVLLIPIVVLLVGVWSAFAFVFIQILAIRRGAKK